MKKLSLALILIGILIAAYPLADRAYSMYLQTKLVMDWDTERYDEDASAASSEEYAQLQSVFEEGAEEGSGSVLPEDTEAVQDPSAEPASTEEAPEPSGKSDRSQQFKAIGRICIDKIDLEIPILEGTTKTHLRLGAGHITGTSKLGEIGNAALAAHRSHTYGRMFNRLDELEVGDGIVVETADGSFEYTVFKKHVVEPDDLSVLNKNDKDRVLTLITCTPLYTATHRLVIHAVIRDNQ